MKPNQKTMRKTRTNSGIENGNSPFFIAPPQNVEYERSVLGVILIDTGAFPVAKDILNSGCFYNPHTKIVWETCEEIAMKGYNIDLLIVKDELAKKGQLDEIGGTYFLTELTIGVVNSAHLVQWCMALFEKFQHRELIRLCSETTTLSQNENDIFEVIESHEIGLTRIIQGNGRYQVKTAMEVLKEVDEELESATDKGKTLGLSTGFPQLNALLYGLKGGLFYILAARPSKGKSSFAMNLALNAAIENNVGVQIFSLEMPSREYMYRIISYLSGIPMDKIMRGMLDQNDKEKYRSAIAKLSGIRLFFDDTPDLNVAQLKSVARKKVMSGEIGLIIIDYLQIMGVIEGKYFQTRDLEISHISSSLKKLAKELNVPIIALSQLNRAIEARQNKKPMLSDLRECLSSETSQIYTECGLVYNNPHDLDLVTFDGRSIKSTTSHNIPKEKNIVYRLKTQTGRFIDATANHLILTSDGYKKLEEIDETDSIAIARGWNNKKGQYIKESRFIGWMLGNGCMCKYNSPSFIIPDPKIAHDFVRFVKRQFHLIPKTHRHRSLVYQYDMTASDVRTKEGNSVRNWLKEKELWGNKSFDKNIPKWFMEKSDEQSICELIQGLWETDGSVPIGKKNYLKYTTTSKILAEQIIYLLAKIGIIAHLKEGYKSEKTRHLLYEIIIQSFHEINIFKKKIKLRGQKGKKFKLITETNHPSHHSNVLGRKTTERLYDENDSNFRIQIHGDRRLTQQSLREVLKTASEKFIIKNQWLASESIFWDKVDSIQMIGEVDIFDRSVPYTHNFVVNGIIVHNSGSLEQDADVVLFMSSSVDGFVDFDLAKNRNGKTDTFQLAVDFSIQKFFHRDTWIAHNQYGNNSQQKLSDVDDLPF